MKKQYLINGGRKINGIINIQGSKNAALPIIVSSIMCKDIVRLANVPNIKDIDSLISILKYLNCKVSFIDNILTIDSTNLEYKELLIPEIKEFRASYYFMGVFLALFNKVIIYQPGGCKIGHRPIDQHIKGLSLLNASIDNEMNILHCKCDKLVGNEVCFDICSVGATINILLASILATNHTIIKNAAKEPEIEDLCLFLNKMGAKIYGIGSDVLFIEGVNKLHSCNYEIMPDRIVCGTYMIYGAALSNHLQLNNIRKKDMYALINVLVQMGVNLDIEENSIIIHESNDLIKTNVSTGIFPLFPSDLQQVLSVLLLKAKGNSYIEEKLFENRFTHLEELKKMGASYFIYNNKALLINCRFEEALLQASDLRGGAALLLACLISKGSSTLKNVEYIERGYEHIIELLNSLGADIIEEEYEEA